MRQAEWEVVMLRKAVHSACRLTYGFAVSESNYRAELMALIVGRFAGSGVGHVPKLPAVMLFAASRNAPQAMERRHSIRVNRLEPVRFNSPVNSAIYGQPPDYFIFLW
jgi:hypothetical protein